jgi:sulfur-oxidizing protein SoxZ
MARTLLTVPASARRGEVIEIKALIAHRMDTGYLPDAQGKRVPRDIIERFICRYNGQEVFSAQLFPAVASNPYLLFHTLATESGMLEFEWRGDNGFAQTERVSITVT